MNSSARNVLVVDDDAASREWLCVTLAAVGYRIHEARDGCEALRRLEETRYDLVLSDYRMPNMNGLQLLRIVRARWPETPVIIVSGDPPETAWLVLQYGASACLPKPCDPNRLLQALSDAAAQAGNQRTGPCATRVAGRIAP